MTVSRLHPSAAILVFFVICLVGVSPATAQSSATKSSGYTLKIGYLFPASGSTIYSPFGTTALVKPRLLTLGVAEDVGKTATVSPVTYGYYADYLEQGSKSATEDVTASTRASVTGKGSGYAIGIQAKAISATATSYSPYLGGGIGYYRIKGSLDGIDKATGNSSTFSASKNGIGGKLFVGLQTKSGLLGELEYEYIPEVDAKYSDGSTAYKSKLSGFGVRIGLKI